mmetsp:Transcript_6449/g.15930  ORF Transcript_6449/g.15930 Transcript_6449/m.15930 type:complete len:177 (-) Transcript_6449:275-805(-)|eukprot:g18733.t1
MYYKKFGEERTKQMIPHMQKVGLAENIHFSYGGLAGNTFDSHRLLSLALRKYGEKAQNAVVDELFKNYFEEEKHLGDFAVLENAARKGGVSAADIAKLKEDEEFGKREVVEELAFGAENAVSGVPAFFVTVEPMGKGEVFGDLAQGVVEGGGRRPMVLSGAQEASVFAAAFKKLLG